jgi:tRNA(Ile)-lysidine synthase
MPYAVEEINSGAVDNINEAAVSLREIEEYVDAGIKVKYRDLVKREESTGYFSVEDIRKEPIVIQKGIIYKIMEELAGQRKDLEAKHVGAVLSLLDKQVGRCVHLPYRIIAEREYDRIKLYTADAVCGSGMEEGTIAPVKIKTPGTVNNYEIGKSFKTELINYKKNITIPKSSCMKWFDYDKIENAVEIRTRKEGDYIQINETGGNKKLKDYFIDHKIPKKLRDSQILIADGSHIMWIPGEWDRMSEKYKVSESTTKILLMKMCDLEENEDDR